MQELTEEQKKQLTPKEIALAMISRPKLRLYSPGIYWVFGLIFGSFPVFLMSYFNSLELANGYKMQKILKYLFAAFLLILISQMTIVFLITQELIPLIEKNMPETASFSSIFDPIKQTEQLDFLATQMSDFSRFWYQHGDYTFLALKLTLLICLLYFVYKYERPEYKKKEEQGQVEIRKYRYILIASSIFIMTIAAISLLISTSIST